LLDYVTSLRSVLGFASLLDYVTSLRSVLGFASLLAFASFIQIEQV
jgi:hypothetical protein